MHLVCHYSLTPCSLSRVELASKVLVKTQETQNRLNGRKLNWHRLLSAQLLIKQIVHVKALRLKRSIGESSLSFHVNETQLQVLQAICLQEEA